MIKRYLTEEELSYLYSLIDDKIHFNQSVIKYFNLRNNEEKMITKFDVKECEKNITFLNNLKRRLNSASLRL